MDTGVYKIVCLIINKIYIGSASNSLEKRRRDHFKFLLKHKHSNYNLQKAYDEYGVENLEFEILEFCSPEKCIEREQYYLDTLLFAQEYLLYRDSRFLELGFNINPTATNAYGRVLRESSKEKIGNSNRGKKRSLEQRIEMFENFSQSSKERLSELAKERWRSKSEEEKKSISNRARDRWEDKNYRKNILSKNKRKEVVGYRDGEEVVRYKSKKDCYSELGISHDTLKKYSINKVPFKGVVYEII